MHGLSLFFTFGLLLTGCGGGVNSKGADGNSRSNRGGKQKVRCEESAVSKFAHYFTLFLLLSFSSGCATVSLWKHENALVLSEKIPAEVDQIYANYDTRFTYDPYGSNKDISIITYLIHYRLLEHDKLKNKVLLFPEKSCCYLTVVDEIGDRNKDDIENKFKQEAPFQSTSSYISEIDAKTLYIVHVDGLLKQDVELNFTYNTPDDTKPVLGSIVTLDAIPPFTNHGAGIQYINWEPVNYIEETHSHYYNLCCYNARLEYPVYIDLSGFTPLLPQSMIPLRTYFYRLEPEMIYKYPFYGRLIGTPVSLAFDFLTWPVQFFSKLLGVTQQVP
jgi:hypothetical protein